MTDALEKLGQEAARLQTVIDTVPSFLWTSLPDGSKEYLNKRWYEYTGLSLEEGKGWGWKVDVHPDDLDRLLGPVRNGAISAGNSRGQGASRAPIGGDAVSTLYQLLKIVLAD